MAAVASAGTLGSIVASLASFVCGNGIGLEETGNLFADKSSAGVVSGTGATTDAVAVSGMGATTDAVAVFQSGMLVLAA